MSEQEKRRLENGAALPVHLFRIQQEAMLEKAFLEQEAKRSRGTRLVALMAFVFAALLYVYLGHPFHEPFRRLAFEHSFLLSTSVGLVTLFLIAAGIVIIVSSEICSVLRYRAFSRNRSQRWSKKPESVAEELVKLADAIGRGPQDEPTGAQPPGTGQPG